MSFKYIIAILLLLAELAPKLDEIFDQIAEERKERKSSDVPAGPAR